MALSPTLRAFLNQLGGAATEGISNILSDITVFKAAITELAEGAIEIQDDGVQIVAVAGVIDFVGAGVVVTDQGGGNARVTISGGAGGALDFEEEGVAVVTATVLNAVGAGVTITDVAGVATLTVPGTIAFEEEGGAVVSSATFNAVGIGGTLSDVAGVATLTLPGIAYQEEGAGVVSAVILNFVGSAVTVADVAGVATVTITGGTTAWQEEGAAIVTAGTANFVGAGATVTDVGGVATITIPGELPTFIVTQEEVSGVDGGGAVGGVQNLRDLNTVKKNTITGASLATSQVTLPAGDYQVSGWQTGFSNGQFKSRLRDTTGIANLLIGASVFNRTGVNGDSMTSPIDGVFTIGVSSVIELQMFATSTKTVDGMGAFTGSGDAEVYAYLQFTKLD